MSMTTDFAADRGCPEPHLRAIAEAGFTHVHWCHHWNTDFVYCDAEIGRIDRWLHEFGLRLLDLHASAGVEKAWGSDREYERRAGVELVANRVEMTSRLGGDAVVLHLPQWDAGDGSIPDPVRRSIDELAPVCRRTGIRIALENGPDDDCARHRAVFAGYPEDVAVFCYDSGHGAIGGHGLDRLEELKDLLFCVHLHDNDGISDLHNLPFTGVVDWDRLADVVARSAYRKCVNLESNLRGLDDTTSTAFLRDARAAAERITDAVAAARSGAPS